MRSRKALVGLLVAGACLVPSCPASASSVPSLTGEWLYLSVQQDHYGGKQHYQIEDAVQLDLVDFHGLLRGTWHEQSCEGAWLVGEVGFSLSYYLYGGAVTTWHSVWHPIVRPPGAGAGAGTYATSETTFAVSGRVGPINELGAQVLPVGTFGLNVGPDTGNTLDISNMWLGGWGKWPSPRWSGDGPRPGGDLFLLGPHARTAFVFWPAAAYRRPPHTVCASWEAS